MVSSLYLDQLFEQDVKSINIHPILVGGFIDAMVGIMLLLTASHSDRSFPHHIWCFVFG